MMRTRTLAPWCLLGLLFAVLTGCASTAGSAKTGAGLPPDATLTQYTKVAFATSAGGDATPMSELDRDRIVRLVATKLVQRAPARFTDLAAASPDAETLKVTIAFTRYDEGNAFARFMLAGLGQIRINADVTLEDAVRAVPLGRYEVTKTFAWGGIYGASTGIRDVEEGFADAVANVVLGRAD
jgi:hypothetical protein